MAKMDKYLTVEELRSIANILESLGEVQTKINDERGNVSIAFFEDDEGWGQTTPVYDSNGETLGHIGYGEGAFVMYLENDDDA